MGAFLLYRSDASINMNDAKSVFLLKGFGVPKHVDLGHWHLLHYKKISLDVENFIIKGDCALFSCGTVVYRGLGYRDSLKLLLKDFQRNAVDQEDLIGHFCLLFWNGSHFVVLTDRMNTLHVFVNQERTCFSSSFLAMLSASPKPLPFSLSVQKASKISGGVGSRGKLAPISSLRLPQQNGWLRRGRSPGAARVGELPP